MNGRFLLDTNIVIALFAGYADVAASLAALKPHLDALPLSFIHRPAIFQAGIALSC
jgi:predicted nucleic acid-binding protein